MLQEVISQEQEQRHLRQEAPADPFNDEEMNKDWFVASLVPDLCEEILITAVNGILKYLPPDMQVESQIL